MMSKIKTISIIRDILKKHGGVYITPDIHTESGTEDLNRVVGMNEMNKKHSESTGTDINSNQFKDSDEAIKFFTSLGFKVKRYKWGELVSDFSCIENPNLDKKILNDVIEVMKRREIWEMTLL